MQSRHEVPPGLFRQEVKCVSRDGQVIDDQHFAKGRVSEPTTV